MRTSEKCYKIITNRCRNGCAFHESQTLCKNYGGILAEPRTIEDINSLKVGMALFLLSGWYTLINRRKQAHSILLHFGLELQISKRKETGSGHLMEVWWIRSKMLGAWGSQTIGMKNIVPAYIAVSLILHVIDGWVVVAALWSQFVNLWYNKVVIICLIFSFNPSWSNVSQLLYIILEFFNKYQIWKCSNIWAFRNWSLKNESPKVNVIQIVSFQKLKYSIYFTGVVTNLC